MEKLAKESGTQQGLDLLGTGEPVISPAAAARLLPKRWVLRKGRRTLKHPSAKQVIRWITLGFKGVRLAGVKVGVGWFTSAGAVQRFTEACTQLGLGKITVADAAVDAANAKAATHKPRPKTKAERELEAAGWMNPTSPRKQTAAKKAS
jgi:hypothetical protein